MTDQQKAGSLPLYGNPIVRSPHLEKLAAEGSLFTRAFTSCPLCVPARVSMFTGQYPSAHGSLDNNELMFPGKRHLLRLLKEAGFATGLAGKNHCFRAEDLALFDVLAECSHLGPNVADETYAAPRRFLQQTPELKGCWTCVVNPYPPERLGTHWITDRAIEFVEGHRRRPFFLWYSIGDPHIPFQTAEPYASMYPAETVDMPVQRDGEMDGKPRAQRIDRHVMRGDDVSEQRVRRIRSIYYGMNSYIDDEVGRFLSRLDELGLADDTLVIYTSDHGEYLGEHRMIRKSKSAYDCLTHVPFILRGPGVPRGERRGEFVSLEDVMPTVLRAAGLEVPAEVQGRDLGSLMRGERFADRGLAYVEYGGHAEPWPEGEPYAVCSTPDSSDWTPRLKVGGYGRMRAVRTERWKLVTYVGDVPELYDLQNDPGELENIHGRPGTEQIAARLRQLLLEQMMRVANPGTWPGGVS